MSYEEVGNKADVDSNQAKRMLRHAMTNNLFCEPEPGKVAHTAESALLVRQKGIRDWVGYTTEESFRCSAHLIEATERWGSSERADQSAYQVAFSTDLTMFEHMAKFPSRAERFANTMTEMTTTDAYNVRHLVKGFSWDRLEPDSTVVDVSLALFMLFQANGVDFV